MWAAASCSSPVPAFAFADLIPVLFRLQTFWFGLSKDQQRKLLMDKAEGILKVRHALHRLAPKKVRCLVVLTCQGRRSEAQMLPDRFPPRDS